MYQYCNSAILILAGGQEAQGIVQLQLEELSIAYEKANPHIATVTFQLTSLCALDLLQVNKPL